MTSTDQALQLGQKFIIEKFNRMNEAPHWGFKPNLYSSLPNPLMNDNYTFQEICHNEYNGILDDCLDVFFRNTINEHPLWFSDWVFRNGYFLDLDDLDFIIKTFYKYFNECSVNELKDLLNLELDIILK